MLKKIIYITITVLWRIVIHAEKDYLHNLREFASAHNGRKIPRGTPTFQFCAQCQDHSLMRLQLLQLSDEKTLL
jgi:hypothetical protein